MEKYKNKYRISSARASWWDYSWAGAYFITICTENRKHFFGEIEHGKMILSNVGVLADIFWYEIPNHSEHVELGAFVVMPNHIHGILILNPNVLPVLPTVPPVQTLHATSLPPSPPSSPPIFNEQMSKISPTPNSVSTIIRSYKSAVTKHTNRLGLEHGWQTRFHDHIIRNDAEYQRINDYIEANPKKWEMDKFFK